MEKHSIRIDKYHIGKVFMRPIFSGNSLRLVVLLTSGVLFAYIFNIEVVNNTIKQGKNSFVYRFINSNTMNILGFGSSSKNEEWRQANSVYDFTVKNIDNQDVKLDKYKGKVLLVVNVASKCGFTKNNYKELNELYSKYKDQGLAILGFPCNQFGHQEPGCDVDIKEFVKKNNVEWDMFAKIDVNGDGAIPLYHWLKSKAGGTIIDAIKWNFTKFLINKEGIPVSRFAPNKNPLEFENEIKAELDK